MVSADFAQNLVRCRSLALQAMAAAAVPPVRLSLQRPAAKAAAAGGTSQAAGLREGSRLVSAGFTESQAALIVRVLEKLPST